MTRIRITRHGRARIKQRLGLPRRAIRRHLAIVLRDGHRREQLAGSLLSYVSWQVYNHRCTCNNPVVHGHHLYIFNDHTLITVLELPTSLKPLADNLK